MNEQNPYNRNGNNFDNRQQPYQPQPPYRQQPYQQQPPYRQQPYQPQPPYQQPYRQSYQQPYRQPGYVQRQPGGGAAKAFAVVSFVAGIVSLMIVMLSMVIFAPYFDTYGSAGMFGMSMVYGSFTAFPGLLFGILALAKKTRLFALGLLGVIFNGLLITEIMVSAVMLSQVSASL